MEINIAYLHHIEHSTNTVEPVDLEMHYDKIKQIVTTIIDEIFSGKNKRACKIPEDSTLITDFINGVKSSDRSLQKNIVKKNATRLVRKERDAQEQYAAITNIPKGSLFHLFVMKDDKEYFIITKTDHDVFLDEIELTTRKGIPLNKKTYKSYYCELENNQPINSYVYDPSGRSAQYWWKEYLDLELCISDADNTIKVLDHLIDKVILPIKTKSPDDYRILRADTIGYFRSNNEFHLSNYMSSVWENYKPVLDGLDLGRSLRKLDKMTESEKFDTSFSIKHDQINKRIKQQVKLSAKMELRITEHMDYEELKNNIQPVHDGEGKWLKIRTELGYEHFRGNEDN